MEDLKDEIHKDALQLCLEIVQSHSTCPFGEEDVLLISIEETQYDVIDIGMIRQFLYSEIETPFYLKREGLVRFVDPMLKITRDPHRVRSPKGFRYVQINIDKMKNWTETILEKQLAKKERVSYRDIWSDKFKFIIKENKLFLPPYGELIFSNKNNPSGKKTNQRAELINIVTLAGQEGISARDVQNKLKEKMSKKLTNREIDSMLVQLNKRFEGKFKSAVVLLKNIGLNNIKRIKLSVQIPTKT